MKAVTWIGVYRCRPSLLAMDGLHAMDDNPTSGNACRARDEMMCYFVTSPTNLSNEPLQRMGLPLLNKGMLTRSLARLLVCSMSLLGRRRPTAVRMVDEAAALVFACHQNVHATDGPPGKC